MRRAIAGAMACTGGLVVLAGLGCQTRSALGISPGPVVKEQRLAPAAEHLFKVAVIPFYPAETLGRSTTSPGVGAQPPSRWESAALVSNFVSEALAAEGYTVIPPSDVELAFTGAGHPVPRLDPRAAAELSERSFGVTSVMLGKVMRYREREGGAAGATRPASVAFEVSLHHVPTGRRLWTGRFDETQQSLTANVFRAREYPGGGTRWLSASEFARWGAGRAVRSLVSGP